MTRHATAHRITKRLANAVSLVVMAPLALPCWLESRFSPTSEGVFAFFAHAAALFPGLPGVYLRAAFYRMTLERCDQECYIGFGAFCSHRAVVIERHAYVGPYAIIGSSHLGEHALIGSRVSIVSGTRLHQMDVDGRWSPTDLSKLQQIRIGRHAWVGEGAILMADIGAHTMVAAGSVVSTPVAGGVAVAGNPARFVRRLRSEPDAATADNVEGARA